MLCGISTSFPVLSPIRRQVAHALLTRPPLIRFRRSFTVRLECVMHAASVHPEPGSNSRINCIHHSFRCHKSSELSLALYFALSMCPVLTGHLFKGFPRFRTRSFACTSISCCSIVNDPSGFRFRFCFCHHCLADSLTIISLSFPFVKGFFKTF